MKRLLIIGASGHGKVVADIAMLNGYQEIAFLDDNPTIKQCAGHSIIGKSIDAEKLNASQVSDFFVAIGNNKIREQIYLKLYELGLNIVSLVHPNAIIASNVHIGNGTVIMAGVIINPESIIGKGCIINTGATIDHDDKISDFVHISVGAHLCGTVSVGKTTWVGTGTIICNNISVCSNSVLGAGTVVIENISKSGTYIGVPSRKVLGS